MQLYPHLTFSGECEAAFRFYENCLGGEIALMMTYGDSPMTEQTPPAWRGKIIHATFSLSGIPLFSGSDAPPETYRNPQGFAVQLNIGDPAEADRIFQTLAGNGVVQMPFQETFWAARFGGLVDQFGTPWMINCEKST